MFCSPDGDTEFFESLAGVLQGGTLAPHIYIYIYIYIYILLAWITPRDKKLGTKAA